MNKSMRKANKRLSESREFVQNFVAKPKPTPKPVPKPTPVEKPVAVVPNPKGAKIGSAEIKKLDKGHFFVVVTCGGKRYEIEKRFKSTTKAQEWISSHEYIELQNSKIVNK